MLLTTIAYHLEQAGKRAPPLNINDPPHPHQRGLDHPAAAKGTRRVQVRENSWGRIYPPAISRSAAVCRSKASAPVAVSVTHTVSFTRVEPYSRKHVT